MRRPAAVLAALIIAFLFIFPVSSLAESQVENHDGNQVLRVGFPIQEGFTELDEQGEYSGYTYEYLQEIAQFTGWEYEFVQIPGDINDSLSQMLTMLAQGELDLLGGMVMDEGTAALYDFPGYSYGMAYSTLSVPQENTAVTESNYQSIPNLRIAVRKTAKQRNASLLQFCEANQINAELVYCGNGEEQADLLRDGRADLTLGVDVVHEPGMRIVAKFAPKPYYFATTKGNTDIISKLNYAILKLNESDPYFAVSLYDKYFSSGSEELVFSDAEQEFIERVDSVKVAVVPDKHPFQYFDKNGEFQGIARGIFDRISEDTGLHFVFLTASSHEELDEMMNSGQADCVAGIPYDYDMARKYHVALTRPFTSSQIVMIANTKSNASGTKRVALPYGFPFENQVDSGEITYYAGVWDCVNAVNNGDADFAYGNAYAVEYAIRQGNFRNVSLIPQSDVTQRVCVGVGKSANANLITIINKVIRHIPDSELQSIIFQYTAQIDNGFTFVQLIESYPWESIAIVSVIAVIIVVAILWAVRSRLAASKQIAVTNARYLQLAELANEYIFEYDFSKDQITLSEKCAEAFHCERVIRGYYALLSGYQGKGEEISRKIMELFPQILKERTVNAEVCLPFPQGGRWFRVIGAIIYENGDSGAPLYIVGKLSDIQSEIEERESLRELTQRDSLTNIYNAASCRELIAERLKKQLSPQGALLIMDIDHFKDVNDQYGHFIGDEVLKALAALLLNHFSEKDIIGRLGGDEFIVYISGPLNRETVESKCRALNEAMRGIDIYESGESGRFTLSIGAVMVDDTQDFEVLYRHADRVLYEVKARGRNSYQVQ